MELHHCCPSIASGSKGGLTRWAVRTLEQHADVSVQPIVCRPSYTLVAWLKHVKLLFLPSSQGEMHTIQRRRLLAAQLIRLPQGCDLSHQLLDGALLFLMGVVRPAHIAFVISSISK